MREIDPLTAERFSQQAASLCLCLRITRQDGSEIGLTDHNDDITFGGTLFRSEPGLALESLTMTGDLAPDHGQITTGASEDGIRIDDLDADRYRAARAEIWRVDFEDVAARMLLSVGTLGEILRDGEALSLEYRGQTHALAKVTGRLYQKSCEAQLGGSHCGVDLTAAPFLGQGTVVSQEGLRLTVSGLTSEVGLFSGGTITLDDGVLAGVNRTIRVHGAAGAEAELTLWETFPRALAGGETVSLTAGCDKRFQTCQERFSNAAHFRGFPHIPGNSVLSVQSGGEG